MLNKYSKKNMKKIIHFNNKIYERIFYKYFYKLIIFKVDIYLYPFLISSRFFSEKNNII